ncbi:MAG: hypothetical protein ACKPJF_31795 [Dolichospermum sp.]
MVNKFSHLTSAGTRLGPGDFFALGLHLKEADVGGQNVECTSLAKKYPIQVLQPHYKITGTTALRMIKIHLGHMTMKSTKHCESRLGPNIVDFTKTKNIPAAQDQNVELIGAHIGGSADLTVCHTSSWLSQTICHV